MAINVSMLSCPKCGSSNTDVLKRPYDVWAYCCECAHLWKHWAALVI
jgi:uncharacterized Zn finger protein